jgi:hypothetical protein
MKKRMVVIMRDGMIEQVIANDDIELVVVDYDLPRDDVVPTPYLYDEVKIDTEWAASFKTEGVY